LKKVYDMKITTLTCALLVLLTACTKPGHENTVVPMTEVEMIKRGELLVATSACHDCHSPKIFTAEGMAPDPSRLLSGHPQDEPLPKMPADKEGWVLFNMGLTASVGPWGISYAANLTPHDTGIGNWSFEQFETAIRKGKYKGLENARPLLPPMPWQQISNFSDQDLRAIFAYLQSIKPIENHVPAPVAPDQVEVLQ
jgi:cytochrome c553